MNYVNVPIEISDEEFQSLALQAHEQDITFNEHCCNILQNHAYVEVPTCYGQCGCEIDIKEYERDYISAGINFFLYEEEGGLDEETKSVLANEMYECGQEYQNALHNTGLCKEQVEEAMQVTEWKIDEYTEKLKYS